MSLKVTNTFVGQNGSQYQTNNLNSAKYSLDFPAIARNFSEIAVPAISLFAMSQLTGASAGPLEYAACTTACALFCSPIAIPGCVTACLPLLFLPTP